MKLVRGVSFGRKVSWFPASACFPEVTGRLPAIQNFTKLYCILTDNACRMTDNNQRALEEND